MLFLFVESVLQNRNWILCTSVMASPAAHMKLVSLPKPETLTAQHKNTQPPAKPSTKEKLKLKTLHGFKNVILLYLRNLFILVTIF